MIITNKIEAPEGHTTKADHLEEIILLKEVETLPEEEEELEEFHHIEIPLAKMV